MMRLRLHNMGTSTVCQYGACTVVYSSDQMQFGQHRQELSVMKSYGRKLNFIDELCKL
jgi:hypothetical protein